MTRASNTPPLLPLLTPWAQHTLGATEGHRGSGRVFRLDVSTGAFPIHRVSHSLMVSQDTSKVGLQLSYGVSSVS